MWGVGEARPPHSQLSSYRVTESPLRWEGEAKRKNYPLVPERPVGILHPTRGEAADRVREHRRLGL